MKGDLRCVAGRLMRHDPQRDDPDLETDIRTCPDCSGDGCDDHPVNKPGRSQEWLRDPDRERQERFGRDRGGRKVTDTEIKAATDQLCELTRRWTAYEDIPRSQQIECGDIGKKLHAFGGEAAMRDAYYEATGRNRAATVIAAYFDGIGEWRW